MLNRELKIIFPALYRIAKEEALEQQLSLRDNSDIKHSFVWNRTSQGQDFWEQLFYSDFKNWREDATLPYLKKYRPEVYEMAIQEKIRQSRCTREHAERFQGSISAYFAFGTSFKGYDFWRKVCNMGDYDVPKETIGVRLNKKFPFIVRDSNGRLLYREDHKGNWYRRKYNKQGNLILIKNNKGKLWRTTVTTG